MENKIKHILDLIDKPENCSEEDLRFVMEDDEARDFYNSVRYASDALNSISEPDIDKEWARFCKINQKNMRPGRIRFMSLSMPRRAAALIAALVSLSIISAAIGAGYSFFISKPVNDETIQKAESKAIECTVLTDSIKTTGDSSSPSGDVVFKNRSLEDILSTIATHYGVGLRFKSEEMRDLRLYYSWNPDMGLEEVINQINSFDSLTIKLSNSTIEVE